MSKKEEYNSKGCISKESEIDSENDNQSKMINASRAFRNLPPEFVMDNSNPRCKE